MGKPEGEEKKMWKKKWKKWVDKVRNGWYSIQAVASGGLKTGPLEGQSETARKKPEKVLDKLFELC